MTMTTKHCSMAMTSCDENILNSKPHMQKYSHATQAMLEMATLKSQKFTLGMATITKLVGKTQKTKKTTTKH